MKKKRIAIFASGSGTNTETIIRFFNHHPKGQIKLVLSNKKDAPVLSRARRLGVPSETFTKDDFYSSNRVVDLLKSNKIDIVILAGFLWLVPLNLIKAYQGRLINIHPALLPNYGGKGMYGMNVHHAVVANKEKESGITIHHVNEKYDAGNIIFQARCSIDPRETAESLAEKIHLLEQENFPKVIEKFIEEMS